MLLAEGAWEGLREAPDICSNDASFELVSIASVQDCSTCEYRSHVNFLGQNCFKDHKVATREVLNFCATPRT